MGLLIMIVALLLLTIVVLGEVVFSVAPKLINNDNNFRDKKNNKHTDFLPDFVCKTEQTPGLRIGFGSCNKQYKSQEWWGRAANYSDILLYNGDTIYSQGAGVTHLRKAYADLKASPHFLRATKKFARGMECVSTATNSSVEHGLWSVWDDHDFGINDAGGEPFPFFGQDDVQERMAVFKESLHPVCPSETDSKRPCLASRNGVYHNLDVHLIDEDRSDKKVVRITLLDTRSHRKLHAIPSLGSASHILRIFPVFASLTRYFAAFIGLGNMDEHSLLGEEQWSWFENSVCSSTKVDLHIIVSSIQITTKNKFVESWSHFPKELERLLKLLKACPHKQFILISGDVHFSEIMMTKDGLKPLELTSSGFTHNCVSPALPHFLCKYIVSSASKARHKSSTDGGKSSEETQNMLPFFTTKTAFGVLDIKPTGEGAVLEFISTDMTSQDDGDNQVIWKRKIDSFPTKDDIGNEQDPIFYAMEIDAHTVIVNRWIVFILSCIGIVLLLWVMKVLLFRLRWKKIVPSQNCNNNNNNNKTKSS
eukprot:m.4751 g.4751  ORF g.4751 m.4751 type:complete len:535 (+) comp2286_c0_seq1:190-1794(+)